MGSVTEGSNDTVGTWTTGLVDSADCGVVALPAVDGAYFYDSG